ncbi:MAG TPA: DUF2213 domain-containing protein [Burkholderiaceae bacterium]
MTEESKITPTAAGIAYVADGRVLLLKRSASTDAHPLTWGFPAGGIEEGEGSLEAAARESMEETGHRPDVVAPLEERDGFALFLCTEPAFAPVLNDEHLGYCWASPDDLPTPLHPMVADQIALALAAAAPAPEEPAEPDDVAMDESARDFDTNGWFEIKGNPLSKVGVFPYRGRQVGKPDEPDRLFQILRPAEELSDPEAIASFRLLPWIDNHVMLGPEEAGLMPAERKGVQGVVGEDVYFDPDTDDGVLRGNVKLFSQSMATLIEAGKRELSCGYRCKYDWTPGVFKGQPYDAIQRRIRGNHLALVKSGRMGPDVAVLDSIDQPTTSEKEPSMADEKKDEGGSGMTLEAALDAFKQVMPAIKMLMEHANPGAATTTAAAVDADPGKTEEEKKDEAKTVAAKDDDSGTPPPKDDDDKGSAAMDEAAVFRSVMGQVVRRDKLARELSAHIGTFDHSEMTEAEVAAYGVKKLGIKAAAGQEAAVLSGYLAAAVAPSAKKATTAVAMDSSSGGGDFVTRFLQGE